VLEQILLEQMLPEKCHLGKDRSTFADAKMCKLATGYLTKKKKMMTQ
jgi:hypothetical protein